MPDIRQGEPCPHFDLPATSGGMLSPEGLKGQPFVLYFYPKDDTSGCTSEAVDFSALAPEFDALGVRVIGVSPDSLASHERFAGKHGLKVTLLADEDKALIGAFGLWVEKSMYGRKYMGVERATVLVDAGGRIAQLWPKVKVKGHAQEVLDAAGELKGAA